MTPTLTVLLTTIGRPTLARMLESVARQTLVPGDGVLLVSDDHHEDVAAVWERAGLPGRHIPIPDGPSGDWGHTPRNRTMGLAQGAYTIHGDDDDIFAPDAFVAVRAAASAFPGAIHTKSG